LLRKIVVKPFIWEDLGITLSKKKELYFESQNGKENISRPDPQVKGSLLLSTIFFCTGFGAVVALVGILEENENLALQSIKITINKSHLQVEQIGEKLQNTTN
jgi:hypothetical protein